MSTAGLYPVISLWEHPMELLHQQGPQAGHSALGVSRGGSAGRKGKSLLVCHGFVWVPQRANKDPQCQQGQTPKRDHSSSPHRSALESQALTIPLHAFKARRVSNAESRLGPAPNEIISNVAINTDRCRTGPAAHRYHVS